MQTKLLITTIIFMLSQFIGIASPKRNATASYEIILRTSEGTSRMWVSGENKRIIPKSDRFYYGYYLGGLFSKQGELQGKPLNGKFQRYDPKDNILVSGQFKDGLKTGLWKHLNPGGALTETTEYRKGLLYGARVIYKNGNPDILEKYREGQLIGKPKSLNPPIPTQKSEGKSGKIKNWFHKLIKRKDTKPKVEPGPKKQNKENATKTLSRTKF